ncbi:hypothetical protein DPMN_069079 [Dreissena polymorpha]|uniref:Uncharacterized protein n=1 Tax=Dreissena polymorpha TaxID=45954 RepID=A0A9D3Z2T6_DREPO|nr:hypothetical protein DPMN_069079 [Dreissena polymorpha]
MSYQYKSRTILQFANIPRRRTTLLIGLGHAIDPSPIFKMAAIFKMAPKMAAKI